MGHLFAGFLRRNSYKFIEHEGRPEKTENSLVRELLQQIPLNHLNENLSGDRSTNDRLRIDR